MKRAFKTKGLQGTLQRLTTAALSSKTEASAVRTDGLTALPHLPGAEWHIITVQQKNYSYKDRALPD
jgi:hypothetical protein